MYQDNLDSNLTLSQTTQWPDSTLNQFIILRLINITSQFWMYKLQLRFTYFDQPDFPIREPKGF